MKLYNCRVRPFNPEFVYKSDPNYREQMRFWENQGYMASETKKSGTSVKVVYTRPNAILFDITDDEGRVYSDINLRDVIAAHCNVQKVHKSRIKEFMEDVNSGKLDFRNDGNGNFYVIE